MDLPPARVDAALPLSLASVRLVRLRGAGRVELERAFLRSLPPRVLRGLVDFTDMTHTLIPQCSFFPSATPFTPMNLHICKSSL